MSRRRATWRWHSNGELLAEIEETRHALMTAKLAEQRNPRGLDTEIPRLEHRLLELAERAADEAVLFVLEALPGDDWEDLKLSHPPSESDLDRWQRESKVNPFAAMPEWDWRTLGPELLVACLVEPDWDEGDVRAWWKEASNADRKAVYNIAVNLQESGVDLPFYVAATAPTSGGGEPSNTAPSEESL